MDQTRSNLNRTLETREFQNRLLDYIMIEYDKQSFKNPIARWAVESLMKDGFNTMSDDKLREVANRWFPEEFPL